MQPYSWVIVGPRLLDLSYLCVPYSPPTVSPSYLLLHVVCV